MKTNILTITGLAISAILLISGCSKEPTVAESFSCTQENISAPEWICVPPVDETVFSGVGIYQYSDAGVGHIRRLAIANARVDLSEQIQVAVKAKLTNYIGTTGAGKTETVDKAVETITKQVSKIDLAGSKLTKTWIAPSGAWYVLVSMDSADVNSQVKKNLKTSFNNENAAWQQFKSKNALVDLEKEFE